MTENVPLTRRAPWEWRKAMGGWTLTTDCRPDGTLDRAFHAYGRDDLAACSPGFGLLATCEQPNEGSRLCERCMEVVRLNPAGTV